MCQVLIHIMCFFGFHKWVMMNENTPTRKCVRCKKYQVNHWDGWVNIDCIDEWRNSK